MKFDLALSNGDIVFPGEGVSRGSPIRIGRRCSAIW